MPRLSFTLCDEVQVFSTIVIVKIAVFKVTCFFSRHIILASSEFSKHIELLFHVLGLLYDVSLQLLILGWSFILSVVWCYFCLPSD
jgi:hypothetical protein